MVSKVGVFCLCAVLSWGLFAAEWSNSPVLTIKQAQNLYFESENEQSGSLVELGWRSSLRQFVTPSIDFRGYVYHSRAKLFAKENGKTTEYDAGISSRYLIRPNLYLRGGLEWNRYRQLDYSPFAMWRTDQSIGIDWYINERFQIQYDFNGSHLDYDDDDFEGRGQTHRMGFDYQWTNNIYSWSSISTKTFKVMDPFSEYSNRLRRLSAGLVWDSSERHRWSLIASYSKKTYPDFNETYINKSRSIGLAHTMYLKNSVSIRSGMSWFDRDSTRQNRELNNVQISSSIRYYFSKGSKYKGTKSTYRYFYQLSIKSIESEHYKEAKKYLSHLINLGYEDTELWFEMGYCLYELGEYGQSIKWFKKVLEQDELHIQSYYLLAYSYLEMSQDKAALSVLIQLAEWVDDSNVNSLIETLQ